MCDTKPYATRSTSRPCRQHAEEDCYAFTHIATELARAIREGSAAIGIEGAWGTGKTSLLNLLRIALDEQKEVRTYVLNISPWLDSSDNHWWQYHCCCWSPVSLSEKKKGGLQTSNGRTRKRKKR